MSEQILRLVIDFGSTVSAMGWQLFEVREDAPPVPVPGTEHKATFPTVILQSSKNPKARLKNSLYGEDALKYMRKFPAEADTGFKAVLLGPEKPERELARLLSVQFFRYLLRWFEENHGLSQKVFADVKKEVFLTKPLVSTTGSDQRLLEIAREAGFTPEGGYVKLEKLDEVRSLADLAMQEECCPLRRELERELAPNPGKQELVLFIDIGGLTADIVLTSVSYDPDRDYTFRQLGIWPAPGDREHGLGGGAMVDRALGEYLKKEGFLSPGEAGASPDLALAEYKIWANDACWRRGETPAHLTGLPGADSLRYSQSPDRQLSPQRVLRETEDYLRLLTQGIRAAIRDGAASPAARGLDVREETVDWVFLTGGGSNFFPLRSLLRGQLDLPDPLRLEKVKQSPDRLLGNTHEDPTLSCVSGALISRGRMVLSANADYTLRLTLYPVRLLRREPDPIWTVSLPLMRRGEPLPKELPEESASIPYTSTADITGVRLEITLLQGDTPDASAVEQLASDSMGKNTKTIAADSAHLALNAGKALVVPGLLAGAAVFLKGTVDRTVGGNLGDRLLGTAKAAYANNSAGMQDKMKDLTGDINMIRSQDSPMTLRYHFSVTRDRSVKGGVTISAETLKGLERVLELELG